MVTSISQLPAAGASLTVLYDRDCGFCSASARFLHRLDRHQDGVRRLRLLPLQRATVVLPDPPPLGRLLETMHVVDSEGNWQVGADAWLVIARVLPPLVPLAFVARLPVINQLVEPCYRLIARNRHRIGGALGLTSCNREQP